MKKIFPGFTFIYICLMTFLFAQSTEINSDPATWKIDYSTVFKADGVPVNESIDDLIKKITADSGDGLPVTLDEFIALIKREEASQVYTNELVRYATPKSRHLQKQEHQNYSKVFLKEKRIVAGVKFLKDFHDLLISAENKYGVPRKDIVSILMWESGLGEFTGKHQIFNIFMGQLLFLEHAQEYAIQQMLLKGEKYPDDTMDTHETQARRFAALRKSSVKSLTALLRYSKLYGIDPLQQKGSWGGAIGYTQFMPFRLNVAVDGDNNGIIDLFTWPDAIYSVANYLKEIGNYSTEVKKRRRGIYSYNPSNAYVDGVIAYADTVWTRYTSE